MLQKVSYFIFVVIAFSLASGRTLYAEETLGSAIDALVGAQGRDAIHHTELSINHTKESIRQGLAKHPYALVRHAKEALNEIEIADKDNDDNPHTKEAIKHLNATIASGQRAETSLATKHAEAALSHLIQAIH
jgi:uncharacterized protein (DUF2252 family)